MKKTMMLLALLMVCALVVGSMVWAQEEEAAVVAPEETAVAVPEVAAEVAAQEETLVGTVAAVNAEAATVSVSVGDATEELKVVETSKITKGSEPVMLSDLKEGDAVTVQCAMQEDGSKAVASMQVEQK